MLFKFLVLSFGFCWRVYGDFLILSATTLHDGFAFALFYHALQTRSSQD